MTNFKYNDGGRAKYFKGETGDCVTRAIAIGCDLDYKKVYDDLSNLSKTYAITKNDKVAKKLKCAKTGTLNSTSSRNGVFKKVYHSYIIKQGFKWIPTMKIGQGCKVHLKEDELPKSKIIVQVSRHLTTMVDGVINDTYDCSRDGTRCVYGYYIKD